MTQTGFYSEMWKWSHTECCEDVRWRRATHQRERVQRRTYYQVLGSLRRGKMTTPLYLFKKSILDKKYWVSSGSEVMGFGFSIAMKL